MLHALVLELSRKKEFYGICLTKRIRKSIGFCPWIKMAWHLWILSDASDKTSNPNIHKRETLAHVNERFRERAGSGAAGLRLCHVLWLQLALVLFTRSFLPVCLFFSSSSHVLAWWLSLPQTWLPHILPGGENHLSRCPHEQLVHLGSDKVWVVSIPDLVSVVVVVVEGLPMLEWGFLQEEGVAPESWRPNSSNI